MDQADHVMSVTAITVCKAIRNFLTEMDFWYQTDLLGSFFSRLSGTENPFELLISV